MTKINFISKMLFSEYDPWHPHHAVNEIEIYCELLEHLQDRIDCLETRGRDEEVALLNVQAVISSYAIEIAMKSFWALDFPGECVPHTHDIVEIFDALKEETVKSLEGFQLTRQVLEGYAQAFHQQQILYGARHMLYGARRILYGARQKSRHTLSDARTLKRSLHRYC